MNTTFQRVAAHCGLRLSYYTLAALLTISFLSLLLTEYRTASPLYILLALAFLPSLMQAIFFPKSKKGKRAELPEAFPLFCKKYRYHDLQYKSMCIAYFLIIILLAAWHLSYRFRSTAPVLVTMLPASIAVISLLVRILGSAVYHIYFHFFPLKAMK